MVAGEGGERVTKSNELKKAAAESMRAFGEAMRKWENANPDLAKELREDG